MTRLALLLLIATSAFAQPFQLQPGAPLRVQNSVATTTAFEQLGYDPSLTQRCAIFPTDSEAFGISNLLWANTGLGQDQGSFNGTLSAGTAIDRARRGERVTGLGTNQSVTNRPFSSVPSLWRGTSAGVGGYRVWWRWHGVLASDAQTMWVGLFEGPFLGCAGGTYTFTTGQAHVFVRCDGTQSLRVCSGLTLASSTCTTVTGADFGCAGNLFDTTFTAEAGPTGALTWRIQNVGTGAVQTGTVTDYVPDAGLFMMPVELGCSNSLATQLRIGGVEVCTWTAY